MNHRFATLLIILLTCSIWPAGSYATASSSFVVAPAKIEIKLKPGQRAIQNIKVTNKLGRPAEFKVTAEDISGSKDETLAVKFYGGKTGPYSIKNYLIIANDTFQLDNGETKIVPVMVLAPADAAPGGLYGAVMFSISGTGSHEFGADVSARLGSLIFLKIDGPVVENGAIKDFSLLSRKAGWGRGPVDFQVVYENNGNVYLNPYGLIKVKNDWTGREEELLIEPWFVLPDSVRRRELRLVSRPLIGHATATLYLNKGYNNQVEERQFSFWVVPLHWLIPILVLILMSGVIYKYSRKQ